MAEFSGRGKTVVAFIAMACGVLAVYFPPTLWNGDTTLHGMDFFALHLKRIDFVHEMWATGSLSGWYPRELLGTPFWSNLQNFPWIPTRLLILAVDPAFSYTVGVNLAALLAATFTYLYGRIIGWDPFAAALAGWTFACAGFFAARVTVGHLPLLEAYPALPMLLWLSERALQRGNRSRDLLALAVGTACTVVAGHPQVPAYAVAGTLLYLCWMGRGTQQRVRPVAAVALGAATTLAVWWPMLQLLGRSTRTLALDAARNDIAFPIQRLASLVAPWVDGWPSAVRRSPAETFTGFPSTGYFWDTFAYVGVVPWLIVAVGLGVWLRARAGRGAPAEVDRRGRFMLLLAVGSLLLALPLVDIIGEWIPGTYLRSPARLLYLTTFALCFATGAGFRAMMRWSGQYGGAVRVALATAVAAVHVADVWIHDQPFLYARPRARASMPTALTTFEEHLGSARMAVDYSLSLDFNRRFDDVGFFDSIILARPYRALLALAGLPPETNEQGLRGSALSHAALANLGVRFVVTHAKRDDLPLYGREGYSVYYVPNHSARAAFFSASQVAFIDESEMLERLGTTGFDLSAGLMLPSGMASSTSAGAASERADSDGSVEYSRPASDRIEVRTTAPRAGYVRVIESWDPGWSASVDGRAVPVLRADSFAMAVATEAGEHSIVLEYATPGAATGLAASLSAIGALFGLLAWNARHPSA